MLLYYRNFIMSILLSIMFQPGVWVVKYKRKSNGIGGFFDYHNYDKLIEEVILLLSEEYCGTCINKRVCWYCEQVLLTALKNNNEFIQDGIEHIPYSDTKLYDDETLIQAIALILNECRNCQLYHDEECVINIIRSCLEIPLLGDYIDYRGSVLMYFMDLNNKNKEISQRIHEEFNKINKKI